MYNVHVNTMARSTNATLCASLGGESLVLVKYGICYVMFFLLYSLSDTIHSTVYKTLQWIDHPALSGLIRLSRI